MSWHLHNENLFGSGGDDCKLVIWDLRTNKAQHSLKPHEREVMVLLHNICCVGQAILHQAYDMVELHVVFN